MRSSETTTPIRVLLVEGNADDALMLERALSSAGVARLEITRVALLAEALKCLSEQDFEVILLDLSLPDSVGLDTLSAIYSRYPEKPVVVIGSPGDEALAIEAVQKGAQDYVTKDQLESDLLARAVRYTLERKRQEKALKESDALFRATWDSSAEVMVLSDPEGVVFAASSAFYKLFGYAPEEIIGKRFDILFPEEQRTTVLGQYKAVFQSQDIQPSLIESAIRRADGSQAMIEAHIAFITDSDSGQRTAMLSIVRDITEPKRDEEALKAREELLRSLSTSTPVGIFLTDTSGWVTYSNSRLRAIVGYTPEERPRRRHGAAIHPQDRAMAIREWFAAERERRDFVAEVRLRAPNGEPRWVLVRASPVLSAQGEPRGYVGTVEDITERKLTEQALQQYAERLSTFYQLEQAILAAESPRDIARAAMQQIRRLVPCDRQEVVVFETEASSATLLAVQSNRKTELGEGAQLSLDDIRIPEENGQQRTSRLGEIGDLPEIPPALRILQAEGLCCYITVPLIFQGELIGALNLWSDQPYGFNSTHLDIASEVGNQLAIAIQNARLFEQVRSGRERQRLLSRQVLQVQENERRDIARELHDEIGQALSLLRMTLNSMRQFSKLSALQALVDDGMEILDLTIEQVRNLSLDLRPSLLDDFGLVSALRLHIQRTVRRAGLDVRLSSRGLKDRLPPDLETACFRIAQEALTNVVRHAHAERAGIQLRRRAAELELTVWDNGVGFDVAAARERAAKGFSLGLLSMQERAELAGGRITIRSTPMHGTEIRAHFPLTATQAPGEQEEAYGR